MQLKTTQLAKIVDTRLLLIGIMTTVSTLWLIYVTRHGAWLFQDSVVYMATAEHLKRGYSFLQLEMLPLVRWAPMYSFCLAIVSSITGLTVQIVMRWLSILIYVLINLTASLWLKKHIQNPILFVLSIGLIFFNLPIFWVSAGGITEPLFILLSLWTLLSYEQYQESNLFQWVLIMGLLAGITWLTRYAGYMLVFTGGLLLIFNWKQNWRRRFTDASTYSILALVGILAWLIRNQILTGYFTGPRRPSIVPFGTNLNKFFQITIDWFFPELSFQVIPNYLCLFVLVMILSYLVSRNWRSWYHAPEHLEYMLPHLLYFFVYSSGIVITLSIVFVSPMDSRFLSPVFIPFVFSIVVLLEKGLQDQPQKAKNLLLLLLTGLFFISFRYTVIRYDSINRRFTFSGPDSMTRYEYKNQSIWDVLNSPEYQNEDTIWFSDQPYVVFLYTHYPTIELPHTSDELVELQSTQLLDYREQGKKVVIIWTEIPPYPLVESVLQNVLDIVPVETTEFARIYVLK